MRIKVMVEAPGEIVRLFERQRELAEELKKVTEQIYEKTFADMTLDSGEIGKTTSVAREVTT